MLSNVAKGLTYEKTQVFFVCVAQRATYSWPKKPQCCHPLGMTLTGFSNCCFWDIYSTFLDVSVGNSGVTQHHEIAQHHQSNREVHAQLLLFFPPRRALEDCGTPWRKLQLSLDLESYSWLHSATRWHGRIFLTNYQWTWGVGSVVGHYMQCSKKWQARQGKEANINQDIAEKD